MLRVTLIVTLLCATLVATPEPLSPQKTERARITAASSVLVREKPSVEVRIVATLPLAVDLVELGTTSDGLWVEVRTPTGITGWISAELTRPVPAGDRDRVLREIVQSRVNRADFGFQSGVELVDVIEQLQARTTDASTAASLALYRLNALSITARLGSDRYRPVSRPVAAWYDARTALLVFNEPGRLWMLRRDAIVAESERHKGTRVAEQIAWLAVTNGLPGECEGDVPCYFTWRDRLEGDYLRQYPNGIFVASALRRILELAISTRSMVDDRRLFDPARDCRQLKAPLASLRAAVAVAKQPQGQAALHMYTLQVMDDVGKACPL